MTSFPPSVPAFLALVAVLSFLALLTPSTAQPNTDGRIPDSAANGVTPITRPSPRPTIYRYLNDEPSNQLNVLAAALDARGLSSPLDDPATRFTVLAPSDAAFADLARRLNPSLDVDQNNVSAVVEALLLGLAPLRSLEVADFISIDRLLKYHLIGDDFTYQQLEEVSPVETMSGINLRVIDGEIVDRDPEQNVSASVQNVFALNGWVHQIPQVLLSFPLQRALEAAARETPSPTPSPTPFGTPSPIAISTPDIPVDASPPALPPTSPGFSPRPPAPTDAGNEDDEGEEIIGGAESAGSTPEGDVDGSPQATDESEESVCFPGDSLVTLASGRVVRMHKLVAGDRIHVHEDGTTSRVVAFTHRMSDKRAIVRRLTTASGHSVRMTGGHYVYANGRLTAARAVRVGDVLRTVEGESRVVGVRVEKGEGLFAPHTMHGDLVVDGVVVSGYSSTVMPWLAHALLAPVRIGARLGWREPLGAVFYDGADGLAWAMPGGRDRY